jgi:hypothetical protein
MPVAFIVQNSYGNGTGPLSCSNIAVVAEDFVLGIVNNTDPLLVVNLADNFKESIIPKVRYQYVFEKVNS